MFTRTESHDMRLLTSCGNKNKKSLRFTVSRRSQADRVKATHVTAAKYDHDYISRSLPIMTSEKPPH